jgi:hypothetical protein
MQNECTLIIDSNGDCKMVLTAAAKLLKLTDSPSRRASHVIPANTYLRLAFQAIRKLVADDSRLAAWTRTWSCMWLVDMRLVGAGILPVHYSNRLAAIDAEVAALNQFFIGEQS